MTCSQIQRSLPSAKTTTQTPDRDYHHHFRRPEFNSRTLKPPEHQKKPTSGSELSPKEQTYRT